MALVFFLYFVLFLAMIRGYLSLYILYRSELVLLHTAWKDELRDEIFDLTAE